MQSYRTRRPERNVPVRGRNTTTCNAQRHDWSSHVNASGMTPEQTRDVLQLVFDLERALWILSQLPDSDSAREAREGLEVAQADLFRNVLWNNVDQLAMSFSTK